MDYSENQKMTLCGRGPYVHVGQARPAFCPALGRLIARSGRTRSWYGLTPSCSLINAPGGQESQGHWRMSREVIQCRLAEVWQNTWSLSLTSCTRPCHLRSTHTRSNYN